MANRNNRPLFRHLAIRAALPAILSVTFCHAAQIAFDVASIKASPAPGAIKEGFLGLAQPAVTPTGITLRHVTLGYCIQWAYQVKFYQVAGPDWIGQERFDILAKSEQPVDPEQLRVMLQALLADRFRLKLHRETRPEPVYELVARNPAPKLQKSTSDDRPSLRNIDGNFVFEHVTMPDFAALLSELRRDAIDRPVVDKTGIEGDYDITLKSAARRMLEDPASIFGSLEAAGFKLEPRKGPLEILVIDRVEKPSPN